VFLGYYLKKEKIFRLKSLYYPIQKDASMKETKAQARIKNMINFIHKHPHCTTRDIATELKSTQRTIQLDLKYLREEWKDGEVQSSRGRHSITLYATPSKQGNKEREKIFLKLALESLENLTDLSDQYPALVENHNLKNLAIPYYIKAEEYEALNTDEEEIKELDSAIKNDTIIEFSFQGKYYHVEPYRLVNFDGIWYLYGRDIEEREENDHKTWLLQDIDDVVQYYGEKHDTPDEEIDEDLANAHAASFIPDKAFDVQLKVSAKVAKLFRLKNHIPRQNSTIQTDGSLHVTSTISTIEEIDPEIKSWLPHIEVIEPLWYKEQLEDELKVYVQNLSILQPFT